jgi:hypothetical protein
MPVTVGAVARAGDPPREERREPLRRPLRRAPRLEQIRVVEAPGVAHLTYRVR